VIRDTQAAIEASKLYVKAQDALRDSEWWSDHSFAANVMQVVACGLYLATSDLIFVITQTVMVLGAVICHVRPMARLSAGERYLEAAQREHRKAERKCN